MVFRLLVLLIAFAAIPVGGAVAAEEPAGDRGAIVLNYMRIGEDAYPDSSLPTDLFREHIYTLQNGGYTVVPLSDIIKAFDAGIKLPPHIVAITFDGAYESAFANGMKILLERKIPFTVFYGSGGADRLNDQALRQLATDPLVTLGITPDEEADDTTSLKAAVNRATARHRDLTGATPLFLAYHSDDYSKAFRAAMEGQGFLAAFGLQSGIAAAESDRLYLPRFTMTERYGDAERLATALSSLPFPAADLEPADPLLDTATPTIGFTVPATLQRDLAGLACFVSGQDKPDVTVVGLRVEIRPAHPLEARTRINCTLPASADPETDQPRWRWLGMLLIVKSDRDASEDEMSTAPLNPESNALP